MTQCGQLAVLPHPSGRHALIHSSTLPQSFPFINATGFLTDAVARMFAARTLASPSTRNTGASKRLRNFLRLKPYSEKILWKQGLQTPWFAPPSEEGSSLITALQNVQMVFMPGQRIKYNYNLDLYFWL